MYSVSEEYAKKIISDNRAFSLRITFGSSTVLTGTTIQDITLDEIVNSGDSLTMGCACSNKITVNLINPPTDIDYDGATCTAEVGLLLNDRPITYEWIPLGKFYATDPETSNDFKNLKLTAYDGFVKMTDKYIFRIGGAKGGGEALRIYTVDGDNTNQVCEYPIPYFDGSKYGVGAKMFLSKDGKTVTIIKNDFGFEDENGICTTTLMIIDTSDVSSPELVKHITVNGLCDFVRNTDGKIVLGTDFVSTLYGYDWSNPEEYLPYYKVDDVKTYFSPEDIICPEKIYQREYSSFFVLDEELNVLSTKAVFGITGLSYVSEDKIVTSVGYGRKYEDADDGNIDCKTDITVIDYSSGVLKIQSVLTADGWVRDRFFIDENDGHLRVITNDFTYQSRWSLASKSASLYIFRLNDCSLVAFVKDFAPEGESATSVRFDGDKCYVCTAEIRTFADPVYFFDLSNYRHISQVNTGFIDGFSSVLINYNDNFLVGIGAKDAETNKVSVYKREGDSVVTVAEYYFKGVFSTDRKAFIIDKENGIFGFASNSYYDDEGNTAAPIMGGII